MTDVNSTTYPYWPNGGGKEADKVQDRKKFGDQKPTTDS
jgi:hypothetical protein